MSNVLNRASKEYLISVHTPSYSPVEWIINSPEALVLFDSGVPTIYWNIVGDAVSEMTQPEKDAVDALIAAATTLEDRSDAIAGVNEISSIGTKDRARIEGRNKRDNYLTTRMIEAQAKLVEVVTVIATSTGNLASMKADVAGIDISQPGAFSPTQTRPLSDAIADFEAEVNSGDQDNP